MYVTILFSDWSPGVTALTVQNKELKRPFYFQPSFYIRPVWIFFQKIDMGLLIYWLLGLILLLHFVFRPYPAALFCAPPQSPVSKCNPLLTFRSLTVNSVSCASVPSPERALLPLRDTRVYPRSSPSPCSSEDRASWGSEAYRRPDCQCPVRTSAQRLSIRLINIRSWKERVCK